MGIAVTLAADRSAPPVAQARHPTRDAATPASMLDRVGDVEIVVLHERPDLVGEARRTIEEFLLLPDSWVLEMFPDGGLPDFLVEELANLPADPAPPTGEVGIALVGLAVAGIAAICPMHTSLCELKRVYVRPAFQRRGIGRLLVSRLLQDARAMGYDAMYLDTTPGRVGSIRLYEDLGFARTETLHDYGPRTVSMRRDLSR